MKQFLFILFVISLIIYINSPFVSADNYNVCTDGLYGLRPENTEIDTWSSDSGDHTRVITVTDPSLIPPEGNKYIHTSHTSWAGWGIAYRTLSPVVTSSVKLTCYRKGSLKFWVKSDVDLKVQIVDKTSTGFHSSPPLWISSYGWNISSHRNIWREITIPLMSFTGIDFSLIYSPFQITAETACNFSVDNVHWTIPLDIISIYRECTYSPSIVRFATPSDTEPEGTLLVNDAPFIVKGVGGTTIPIGYGPLYDPSIHPEYFKNDMFLMEYMNANVIRTYRPITTSFFLDYANYRNLYVIMGFYVDPPAIVTPEGRNHIKRNFLNMVEHWKNHPAVLMWCLGNEVAYELHEAHISDWYRLLNECAAQAKIIDPNHPVITSISDDIGSIRTYDSMVPNLDAWGINSFRGAVLYELFNEYTPAPPELPPSSKPLLITEFGCDRYDGRTGYNHEDEIMQRNSLKTQIRTIYDNLITTDSSKPCTGGCVFSWTDGWWKHEGGSNEIQETATDWTARDPESYIDQNINNEWWGIIGLFRSSPASPTVLILKKGYYTVQEEYARW